MLVCDGYKMFHGTVTVVPKNEAPAFDLTGVWLYRPDTRMWYVKRDFGGPRSAESMPEDILSDFREDG